MSNTLDDIRATFEIKSDATANTTNKNLLRMFIYLNICLCLLPPLLLLLKKYFCFMLWSCGKPAKPPLSRLSSDFAYTTTRTENFASFQCSLFGHQMSSQSSTKKNMFQIWISHHQFVWFCSFLPESAPQWCAVGYAIAMDTSVASVEFMEMVWNTVIYIMFFGRNFLCVASSGCYSLLLSVLSRMKWYRFTSFGHFTYVPA